MKTATKRMSHDERRARRAEIAADVKGGMSVEDAATKYGLATTYIANIARPRKGLGQRSKVLKTIAMLQRGKSVAEVAAKLGISTQAVSDARRRAESDGVSFPEGGGK